MSDKKPAIGSGSRDVLDNQRLPNMFVARNSQVILHGRDSSRWRKSVLQPYNANEIREALKRNAHTRPTNITKNNLIEFQGVSMFFLNQFWSDILAGKQFPNVHLYRDRATNMTVLWEKENPENTQGDYAICRRHAFPEDIKEKILITQLGEIKREDWEIQDLANYCIYPMLTQTNTQTMQGPKPVDFGCKNFLKTIKTQHIGKEFQGIHLLYDERNKFGNLVQAMKNYCREDDLRDIDTYFFIKIFALDLEKVRMANAGEHDMLVKSYSKLLREDFHVAIKQFNLRVIFIENWEKPNFLTHILPLWEAYGIFAEKNISVRLITKDYEGIHERVWDKDSEVLFNVIENLDPSKLRWETENEKNIIISICRTFPKGFKTLRDTVAFGFSRFLAAEANENVSFFSGDLKTEITYVKLCKLLLTAGNFSYRRENYKLAQSYFSDAVGYYEHFNLELYMDSLNGKSSDEDLDKPTHFTRKLVHTLLTGLVASRLGLAKTAVKQFHYDRAIELIARAQAAAKYIESSEKEKLDTLMECELVSAFCFAETDQSAKAASSLQVVEVTWKIDSSKKDRLIKIYYDLGVEYKKLNRFQEAENALQNAHDGHVALLSREEKRQDPFLADIITAMGDVYNKKKSNEKAIESYSNALRIVYGCIGTLNHRVGKLHYLLGNVYGKIKEYDMALKSFTTAIEVLSESQGQNTIEVALTYASQGSVYQLKKQVAQQEESFLNALRVVRAVKEPASYHRQYLLMANYCMRLGQIYTSQERYNEAAAVFDEAFAITQRELGNDHAETKKIQKLQRENRLAMPY